MSPHHTDHHSADRQVSQEEPNEDFNWSEYLIDLKTSGRVG